MRVNFSGTTGDLSITILPTCILSYCSFMISWIYLMERQLFSKLLAAFLLSQWHNLSHPYTLRVAFENQGRLAYLSFWGIWCKKAYTQYQYVLHSGRSEYVRPNLIACYLRSLLTLKVTCNWNVLPIRPFEDDIARCLTSVFRSSIDTFNKCTKKFCSSVG